MFKIITHIKGYDRHNDVPQECNILIPRTHRYVRLQCKGELRLIMWVGQNVTTKVFKRGRERCRTAIETQRFERDSAKCYWLCKQRKGHEPRYVGDP